MKRSKRFLIIAIVAVLMAAVLVPMSAAAVGTGTQTPFTESEIQQMVSLLNRAPREEEYLDEYYQAKISNSGREVYAFNGPGNTSAKLFNVKDGEKLTVVAYYKGSDRYCVIVNSKYRACWIRGEYITRIWEQPESAVSAATNIPFSESEIQQMVSLLNRAPREEEYLDEYYQAKISNSGREVYAFNGPGNTSAKLFNVKDGEKLTVVAYYKGSDRFCVIVNSKYRACWIRGEYITRIWEQPESAVIRYNVPSIPVDATCIEERNVLHYFYVYEVDSSFTWDDAEAYCESLGGHLATLTSSAQNNAAYEATKKKSRTTCIYFGLSDTTKEGTWKWITGEPYSYSNWQTGEPNGGRNENYGAFYVGVDAGKWVDADFKELSKKPIICEWDVKK